MCIVTSLGCFIFTEPVFSLEVFCAQEIWSQSSLESKLDVAEPTRTYWEVKFVWSMRHLGLDLYLALWSISHDQRIPRPTAKTIFSFFHQWLYLVFYIYIVTLIVTYWSPSKVLYKSDLSSYVSQPHIKSSDLKKSYIHEVTQWQFNQLSHPLLSRWNYSSEYKHHLLLILDVSVRYEHLNFCYRLDF